MDFKEYFVRIMRSCPMEGFLVSGADTSGSITILLVSLVG